eukprot:SAG31_NODE_2507_length_5590_cov_2.037880_4_plen_253_part_00
MDVFCRETLAGDWLEVIGLWQPGDARTGDSNRPYTPHPDFWVAALWKRLMGARVLGANTTTSAVGVRVAVSARAPSVDMEQREGVTRAGSTPNNEQWLIVHGQSSDWGGRHGNPFGTPSAPLYGTNITSWQACQALCEAHQQGTFKTKPCRSWSWCDRGCGGQWALRCFGRLDDTWSLHPVAAVTSGCDKSLSKCAPPPPPPPPAPVARVFARECIYASILSFPSPSTASWFIMGRYGAGSAQTAPKLRKAR